jgi:CheY-like chemotaxis protein
MNDVKDTISLLIVDDDADDRFLLDRALKDSGVQNQLRFIEDGQGLIDFLNDNLIYSDLHKSSFLILLDLNMPRLNGWEALKILKKDQRFRKIPVIVFTTSKTEEDVTETYALGANSFFTKPNDYEALKGFTQVLKQYWLEKATLPG